MAVFSVFAMQLETVENYKGWRNRSSWFHWIVSFLVFSVTSLAYNLASGSVRAFFLLHFFFHFILSFHTIIVTKYLSCRNVSWGTLISTQYLSLCKVFV